VIEFDENEKNHVENVEEVAMLLTLNKVFFELYNKLEYVKIVIEQVRILKIFVKIVIEKKE
jgi:hypothetical protein